MVKESKYSVTKILKSQRIRTVEDSWNNAFTKQQMDKANSYLSAINLMVNVLSFQSKVTECVKTRLKGMLSKRYAV